MLSRQGGYVERASTVMCSNGEGLQYSVTLTCSVRNTEASLLDAFDLLHSSVWEVSLLQNYIDHMLEVQERKAPATSLQQRKRTRCNSCPSRNSMQAGEVRPNSVQSLQHAPGPPTVSPR